MDVLKLFAMKILYGVRSGKVVLCFVRIPCVLVSPKNREGRPGPTNK